MTDLPRRQSFSVEEAAARVEAAVKSKLVGSYVRLVEATDTAVDTLLYVAEHGRHEEARVSAAKEILDRADLNPDIRVVISNTDNERETRMDQLRTRLAAMNNGFRFSTFQT